MSMRDMFPDEVARFENEARAREDHILKLETTYNTLAFHNDDLEAFQKHNEENYPRFHREFNELKNKYQERD